MTVVVGILCSDNSVVIGTDSAMTFSGHGGNRTIQQYQSKKIFLVEDQVIVAGAGHAGFQQRFVEVVKKLWRSDDAFKETDVVETGEIIAHYAINDLIFTHSKVGSYGALVAIPVQKRAELIEFGVTDFQPEVKNDTSWYVSMGSGQSIADPLLGFTRKVFWDDNPPNLQEGKLAVTMVLKLACEMAPSGISEPIQMAVLSSNKDEEFNVRKLTEKELTEHDEILKEVITYFRKYQDKIDRTHGESLPN